MTVPNPAVLITRAGRQRVEVSLPFLLLGLEGAELGFRLRFFFFYFWGRDHPISQIYIVPALFL